MASRTQHTIYLLGQNSAVGDLHRGTVVHAADRGVPGNDVVVLGGKGPVLGGHDILTHQTVAAAAAQLGSNIVQIGVFEPNGAILFVDVQDFADGASGDDLSISHILDVGTVAVTVEVGSPVDAVAALRVQASHKAGAFGDHGAHSLKHLRIGLLPLIECLVVDAAHTPAERCGAGAHSGVGKAGKGGPCLAEDIAVASGVNDYLSRDGPAALLALKNHAFDLIVLHDGLGAPAVVQDPDGVLVFQQHGIHLDFQLVGIITDGIDHALVHVVDAVGIVSVVGHAGGIGAGDTAHVGTPEVDQHGITGAHFLGLGAQHRARDHLQTVEPLLLDTPDIGLIVPGQLGYHQHIGSGDVSAGVAVTLHQNDILTTGAGGGDGGAVTGTAATDHKDVTFVIIGDRIGLGISLGCHCLYVPPFARSGD